MSNQPGGAAESDDSWASGLPAEEARPLLRQFPILVPTGVGFMKNAGLVTGPNPDEFEALAGRCAVFRFDPV